MMSKSDLIKLRVDQREKEGFALAAHIAGISLSAWARERLRSAARRELEDAGKPVSFLSDIEMP